MSKLKVHLKSKKSPWMPYCERIHFFHKNPRMTTNPNIVTCHYCKIDIHEAQKIRDRVGADHPLSTDELLSDDMVPKKLT